MLRITFFSLYFFTSFFLRVQAQVCPTILSSEKTLYEKSENSQADQLCVEAGSSSSLLLSNNPNIVMSVSMSVAVRSATGYCTRCEDWVEIYYPSRYCPKCGKKILDAWPLSH
jgi:hypothetical protein